MIGVMTASEAVTLRNCRKAAKPFRVFISGQKFFGQEVLQLCLNFGFDIAGVCCPVGDKYLGRLAALNGIPVMPSGSLTAETMPGRVDLGIAAHSFDYIGRRTRYRARLGWIGYHPSLLPRHRGRSSIEWALRMRDIVTGGTIYWLNDGIDRGDIERQGWIWLDHSKAAAEVWRGELLPLGLRLMGEALSDISRGVVNRKPQDNRFSTFEPSLEGIRDIYKPDMLMLTDGS